MRIAFARDAEGARRPRGWGPQDCSAAEGLLYLRHEVGVERLHRRVDRRAVRRGRTRHALLQRGAQLEGSHGVEAGGVEGGGELGVLVREARRQIRENRV